VIKYLYFYPVLNLQGEIVHHLPCSNEEYARWGELTDEEQFISRKLDDDIWIYEKAKDSYD